MNGDNLEGKAAALEGDLLRAGDGAAPGSGAGPGGNESQAPAGPSTGELIAALLRPTFDIMAPAWSVSDDECAMLGAAYGALLDKYFPNLDFGVEFTAVLVTAAVLGPRLRRPMKPEKKPEVATDAETSTTG